MIARSTKPVIIATAALIASCGRPVAVGTPAPSNSSMAANLPASVSTRPNIAGNWLVAVENTNDGTFRRTYFTLDQKGDEITGTIKNNNSRLTINESAWDSTGFSVTSVTRNGANERRTTYDGRLMGNELYLMMRRRAPGTPGGPPAGAGGPPRPAGTPPAGMAPGGAPPAGGPPGGGGPGGPQPELVAHRVTAGEGALPQRIALPALHVVPDNGIARTPAMGWNSWNKFAGRVDDASVRTMADAMVSSGMKDAGYTYVNIDDTWEGDQRDAQGNITTNRKFPDMKALADYVHSKGLKIGIYSSPGPTTCAGYIGSYGHEAQDAKTFARWGIDYLKYDWCGASMLHGQEDERAMYQIMGDALIASGRQILYSLCQYGAVDVWKWGADVGGNSWRTTGDISDRWASMAGIGFRQGALAPFAKPGHFNDPDMLEIGNGGMTDNEYRTHMTLWSMLASPLLAGNDIRTMTPSVRDILLNREVIAIDQDPMGRQATRIAGADSTREIWSRPLADGGMAIAAFNREGDDRQLTIDFAAMGIDLRNRKVRDLWTHKEITVRGTQYMETVPSHGVVMLRVSK